MKRIIFICSFIVISSFPAFAQQYTVVLRFGHLVNPWNPLHPTEWRLYNLYADIFDSDNNLVPPSNDYHYLWERDYCDGNNFQFWDATIGTNYVIPDGMNNTSSACDPGVPFQTYYARVTVTIDGAEYDSDPVRLPDNYSGTLEQNKVQLTQHRENLQVIGKIGKEYSNKFFNYPAPIIFYYPQTINDDYFRADQELTPGLPEKYNHWVGFSDVTNHKNFTFTVSSTYLISQLIPVSQQITIQNSLEGTTLNSGNIKFADPWYIDYSDNNFYGNNLRNRGMKDTEPDALRLRSRTSPFYPDYSFVIATKTIHLILTRVSS